MSALLGCGDVKIIKTSDYSLCPSTRWLDMSDESAHLAVRELAAAVAEEAVAAVREAVAGWGVGWEAGSDRQLHRSTDSKQPKLQHWRPRSACL